MSFAKPPPLHGYTLLTLLLIVLAGCLIISSPSDVDYWWHLKAGEWIAANGIPQTDPFSHTALGHHWLDHEWLQQWLIQALNQALGYAGPMLLYGLVQATSATLVWRLLREHGAGRRLSLILLLAFFMLAAPTWGVRPQIVASLLLAVLSMILSRWRRSDGGATRSLWWLPLLIGLWANLHGSFMLGLAVIGAYGVGMAIENLLQRAANPRPLRPLLLVFATSLLATLLNPYGIDLWLLPFDYLTLEGSNALHQIAEWRSPDFHQPTALVMPLCLLPLLLFGLTRTDEKDAWAARLDITAALLVTAFTLMALSATYHYPLFGVVVLPIVAAGIARAVPAWSSAQDEAVEPGQGRINLALLPVFALMIGVLPTLLPQSQPAKAPRIDGRLPYPELASRVLARLPAGTRLYNDFGWGGFLIQRLYPQQTVFIDGRVDLYRDRVFDDYLRIDSLQPGWQALLKRYRINAVIIRNGSPLDGALAEDEHWSARYRDSLAVVYVTAVPAAGPAETVLRQPLKEASAPAG